MDYPSNPIAFVGPVSTLRLITFLHVQPKYEKEYEVLGQMTAHACIHVQLEVLICICINDESKLINNLFKFKTISFILCVLVLHWWYVQHIYV